MAWYLSNSAYLFCAHTEEARDAILKAGYFGMREITREEAGRQGIEYANVNCGQFPPMVRSDNFNAKVWYKGK